MKNQEEIANSIKYMLQQHMSNGKLMKGQSSNISEFVKDFFEQKWRHEEDTDFHGPLSPYGKI